MKVPFLDLQHYNSKLLSPFAAAVERLFERSDFIKGEAVSEFAANFSEYIGAKYAVPCGNGTDALEISLKALDLKPSSKIAVPDNTFIATPESVVNAGFEPVFVKFDSKTQNMCPLDLAKHADDSDISAVIFVHLYGNTEGILEVKQICDDRGMRLIEDCAQAHGARKNGQSAGTIGDIAAFSFYPGKVLGGVGDAGLICTGDSKLKDACTLIADHGRFDKYDHILVGRNSRMDTIQALYLNLRLKFLDEDLAARERVSKAYRDSLNPALYETYDLFGGVKHGNHLFVIRTKNSNRDALLDELSSHGIGYGIHYPLLMSETSAFGGNSSVQPSFSRQRDLLSLPIGPHLDSHQLDLTIQTLNEFSP